MLAALAFGMPADAKYQPEVVVSDPYIDLHTGPGRGYPIFYVAAQGDRITILKEQTDWYKVRTPRGKEGWVNVSQMASTLDLDGQTDRLSGVRAKRIRQAPLDVRIRRRRFRRCAHSERDRNLRVYAEHRRSHWSASQVLGDYSDGLHGYRKHRDVAVSGVARIAVFRDRHGHDQRESADDDRAVGRSHRRDRACRRRVPTSTSASASFSVRSTNATRFLRVGTTTKRSTNGQQDSAFSCSGAGRIDVGADRGCRATERPRTRAAGGS